MTEHYVLISEEKQTAEWSVPSNPAAWCQPNVAAQSVAPSRAKLTCERNGLEESDTYTTAARDFIERQFPEIIAQKDARIAKLNERIAVLEADNKAMIVRELSATERMRHWRGRALKLACDLAALKLEPASQVKSSPAPRGSALPEPEKPSQDAVWRNATRFSR